MRLFFLLVVVPALLFAAARAQDDEEIDLPEADEATTTEESEPFIPEELNTDRSEFAITNVLFPDFSDKKFPAGSVIPILIGFQNTGESTFHVKAIEGSFRHPQDYTYHIQNFTVLEANTYVAPHQVAAFNYYIRPHESFEPRDIGLQVTVFYDSEDGDYFDAAFNGTVDIVDAIEDFEPSNWFGYLLLIAACGGAYQYFFRSKEAETQSEAKVETGTASDEDEWLENHNKMLGPKKKEAAKKSD